MVHAIIAERPKTSFKHAKRRIWPVIGMIVRSATVGRRLWPFLLLEQKTCAPSLLIELSKRVQWNGSWSVQANSKDLQSALSPLSNNNTQLFAFSQHV